MGWGEPLAARNRAMERQGDMGAGVLATSARLTARAEHDRCARALADAVREHRRIATTSHAEAMYAALDAFDEARRLVSPRVPGGES